MQEVKLKGSTGKADYDVIVIGTGMGGCAAGGICALHGLKTLILEKNPRPGGACSYYEKEGFQIDTGTHLFIRGNRGPFGNLTKRLGMGKPIDFIRTKDLVCFKGFNINATIPKSMIVAALKQVEIKLLYQAKISPVHYPGILKMFLDMLLMKEYEIDALNDITVDEFIRRYTDNDEIRLLLAGLLGLCFIVPPWEASAGESIWNLRKMGLQRLDRLEFSIGYPKGGAVAIPKTFLKGAESHGAELRLKAGVKKIDIKDNKVVGVILENGEKISATAVISTSNVNDTVEKLAGPEFFPNDYVDVVRELKPSWTAVQAKIAIDKPLIKAGSLIGGVPLKIPDGTFGKIVAEYFEKGDIGQYPSTVPIYAPVPSNYDQNLAPKGCQLITVVGCAPILDVALDHDPQLWIDGMMEAIYQMVPGIKDHIIFCDTWSVKKLSKWIGKSNGSAITTAQTPNQVGFRRPPHETPVRGLYLAGDCAGPARGVGTELACQSGMDCADLVSSHVVNRVI